MANTVLEIANLIATKILSGGRRTTAQYVRDLMTAFKDSYLNLRDGGLNVEALTGYKTLLTPTDDRHFVHKKYVDDRAGGGIEIPAGTLRNLIINNSSWANELDSIWLPGPITGANVGDWYILVVGGVPRYEYVIRTVGADKIPVRKVLTGW